MDLLVVFNAEHGQARNGKVTPTMAASRLIQLICRSVTGMSTGGVFGFVYQLTMADVRQGLK
jgi:hypothetical protein